MPLPDMVALETVRLRLANIELALRDRLSIGAPLSVQ
jgi:hypothetical protein